MYPDVPFVDRENVVSYLRETRDEAEARVHVICGQSGIGKSALARKFADSCEENDYPTLFYQISDPNDEKIFLQRLLAAWFDKHPESTAAQIREYLLSPGSVDDLLSIIRGANPEPTSSLAIEGLRRAISGIEGANADFPDPVQFVTDVMKRSGSPEYPAVVIIDEYNTGTQYAKAELESTFRDVANHLDESVVWYITSNTEIRGNERLECFPLEPFDQDIIPNPGASYPEDQEPFGAVDESSDHGYMATRALVEEAGFEYEESDIVDLHDRTKGIPLLIATICEEPETYTLREELQNKPTTYTDFKNTIQRKFVRGLSEDQRKVLQKASVLPILTEDICVKRAGLGRIRISQILDQLAEQGKLMRLPPRYPVSPAYKCHDFYRTFLIEFDSLSERELRLETSIDCLEIAFDHIGTVRGSEIDDIVKFQLDRFIYQISHISESTPVNQIAELVVNGNSYSEEDISEIISLYLGFGHREYTFEDSLEEIL